MTGPDRNPMEPGSWLIHPPGRHRPSTTSYYGKPWLTRSLPRPAPPVRRGEAAGDLCTACADGLALARSYLALSHQRGLSGSAMTGPGSSTADPARTGARFMKVGRRWCGKRTADSTGTAKFGQLPARPTAAVNSRDSIECCLPAVPQISCGQVVPDAAVPAALPPQPARSPASTRRTDRRCRVPARERGAIQAGLAADASRGFGPFSRHVPR